jgi:transposase
LRAQVNDNWFERYGRRIELYRLPKAQTERDALALTIGRDGHQLLVAMESVDAPAFLAQVPAVETLRQVWLQQYRMEGQQVFRRKRDEQPPNHPLIQSPDDLEARNRTKRQTNWTGYAVHLSETCDPEHPHLITHVHTTPATTADSRCLPIIHQALQAKTLLPAEHLVDTTDVSAPHLVAAHSAGIDLVAPVPPDTSWQSREPEGLDLSCFTLDWDAQQVHCPAGCLSQSWTPRTESDGDEIIEVSFASQDCQNCPLRPQCTRSKSRPRLLKFRLQAEHQALTQARLYQSTDEFKQRYRQRAGVEGTLALATQCFNLRRSRYLGLAKTHLQHILTATAINLARWFHWLTDTPIAKTRTSRFAALASSP